MEKESFNFKGMTQGLANALELEIPNARSRIDGMIDALQAYFDTAPTSAGTLADYAEPAQDMTRGVPEESPAAQDAQKDKDEPQ